MSFENISYQGAQVAFLTQHGKQDTVRGPLEAALGCHLVHTNGYDTDRLGTFTRDIARPGSQLEAARKKAHIGMSLTGLQLGISSEGAFGGGPFAGLIPWGTELVVWIDVINALEIVGIAQGPAQCHQKLLCTHDELLAFCDEAKFPEHHLVVRPEHHDHPNLIKGIQDHEHLIRAFEVAKQQSSTGMVFVENDLRAFANPTRMELISQATANLVDKLCSLCPACHAPGFWLDHPISGRPCAACGIKTRLPVAEIWHCTRCNHTETRAMDPALRADPAQCDYCNP